MKTYLLATLAALCAVLAHGQTPLPKDLTTLPAFSDINDADIFHAYDMSEAAGSRSKKMRMDQVRTYVRNGLSTIYQAASPTLGELSGLEPTEFGLSLLERASLLRADISDLGSIASQAANNVSITGGNISGLHSLKLETSEEDTLEVSEYGLGWVDGRLTLQTPIGAMQFYTTGSPEEAVIYFPGKLIAGSLETPLIVSTVDASLITTGAVPSSVMNNSFPMPFTAFVNSSTKAGANGLTYANTGPLTAIEPATPGIYFMALEVTDGGTENVNGLEGRIRTATQMRSDLQLGHRVTAPSTASSSGSVGDWSSDTSYLYVCVATNTWKRVALSTW